jgi:3-oxoadipate enol-lactonase
VSAPSAERTVPSAGAKLSVQGDGDGVPVVLLHGLTATRRYVVMGSKLLERSGHRVIAYDARGHGRSSPAPTPQAYGYEDLAGDLEAVLDSYRVDRAVLAGASMGAHTLLSFALRSPERVAGVVVITPAYGGGELDPQGSAIARWDALAAGLREGGIDGFVAAYDTSNVTPAFRETVIKVIRQRLSLHQHLDAVADAIRAVPRSRPFGAVADLAAIQAPAAVVASNDEADPEHPFAIGAAYAEAIDGATLIEDQPGASPVAWQGSQLSHVIADVASRAKW